MKYASLFSPLRVAMLVLAACVAVVGPATADDLQKVVFALNWSPTDHHIAYWVALDKGYYAKEGLDVDLQYSKGSGDAIAKVDTGRADIGLTDATALVPAIVRGAKVKMVGMVFEKSPLNFFVWSDSPIKVPRDLAGKTLGAPPGDAQRMLFPAFAKVAGIDPDSVTWVNIDTAAKVGALVTKRVDAIADFTTDLLLFEKAMGKSNVRMMPWAEYGFDLYSLGIIARDDTIAAKPELVRKFLRASYQGWRDVAKDLPGSVAIFKKHVPEIDENLIAASLQEITIGLVKTPYSMSNGIGAIDTAKMCKTVSLVETNLQLQPQVACEQVYTDKLIPRVDFAK
jgi:NitT/TauT family transport system substrate-binding protein